MTEGEMVGWHHWLNAHEFEQAPGDSEGQGSLVCCSPWGHRESDTTERLSGNSNMTVSEKESWAHSRSASQMLLKRSMRETPTSLSHASSQPVMMAVCSRVLAELCMRHPRTPGHVPSSL